MPSEWTVAMSADVEQQLTAHLVRPDGQEDLAFALWNPSEGTTRRSALLVEVLLPLDGEREVHGNVSFFPSYFERACREAMAAGCGVAFLHSHPFPGWQGMSRDDVVAETRLAGAALGLTGLPLVGLTVGNDAVWSARVWGHSGAHDERPVMQWCSAVRAVGRRLRVSFADQLRPVPRYREAFRRTVAMWGDCNHGQLVRLRVGVVGLGSVGSLVAESLARMGLQELVLIDFDRVETHNLDRLLFASERDVGRLKVEVARERLLEVGTSESLSVDAIPYSLAEHEGYHAALDCDVLFSCVDRPRARHILNHVGFAHLIPVVDGGIAARYRSGVFRGVDWQVQISGPEHPCLECLGTYRIDDVSTEEAGKLDDPTYLEGLPHDHALKRNENVFPYSMNLASLEVLQWVGLVTDAAGGAGFGVQRYRWVPGILEQLDETRCRADCDVSAREATGDTLFTLQGRDHAAEGSRQGDLEGSRDGDAG